MATGAPAPPPPPLCHPAAHLPSSPRPMSARRRWRLARRYQQLVTGGGGALRPARGAGHASAHRQHRFALRPARAAVPAAGERGAVGALGAPVEHAGGAAGAVYGGGAAVCAAQLRIRAAVRCRRRWRLAVRATPAVRLRRAHRPGAGRRVHLPGAGHSGGQLLSWRTGAGDCYITTEYDRAAPRGVGHVKVAGNYAADLKPSMEAKARGYPINLYLDAREQRYVEEFGTSNFAGIRYLDERGDRYVYVTPKSESVLAGITNRTLMELTQLEGMAVEHRPVTLDELGHFDEVFATGTAVVITAVDQVVRGERVIPIGRTAGSGHVGPVAQRLYRQVRAIQTGEAPDPAHWTHLVI
eukprot:ctg_282.g112